jgi:hypothetical protein
VSVSTNIDMLYLSGKVIDGDGEPVNEAIVNVKEIREDSKTPKEWNKTTLSDGKYETVVYEPECKKFMVTASKLRWKSTEIIVEYNGGVDVKLIDFKISRSRSKSIEFILNSFPFLTRLFT